MNKKKKTKPLNKMIQELQNNVVNPYIRLRDSKGDFFKCISCGKWKHKDHMQAGHFHSVSKSSGLRFDPDNIHGEDDGCNCYNEDHLIGYTINLRQKLGEEKFEALQERYEYHRKNGKRWTKTEIRELEEVFKGLTNDLIEERRGKTEPMSFTPNEGDILFE